MPKKGEKKNKRADIFFLFCLSFNVGLCIFVIFPEDVFFFFFPCFFVRYGQVFVI